MGYWDMETLTSSGLLKDLSGNGNAGILSGTTSTGGKVGNAKSLNGTSDYISTSTNNFPSANITIDFWAYTQLPASTSIMIANPDDGFNRLNIHLPWQNNIVFWDFGNIDSGGRLFTNFDSSWLNRWNHYTFVSQFGKGMKIYVNSTVIANSNTSSTFTSGAKILDIGRYIPAGTYWN